MRRPRIALMQPTFLPWQGYFALIAAADRFVFLDDFQFVRRSYHQRNRLFVGRDTVGWITVPVAHAGDQSLPLNRVQPALDDRLAGKLRRTLHHNYGTAPFFAAVFPVIEAWLDGRGADSLAAFNIDLIGRLCRLLGIGTEVLLSSTLAVGVGGHRSERILGLLAATGAGAYLSASGSFDYMAADGLFPHPEIETWFLDFAPEPYPQPQAGSFVPYLSVLDALFQLGPAATRGLIDRGLRPFLGWEERRRRGAAPAAEPEPDLPPDDSPAGAGPD